MFLLLILGFYFFCYKRCVASDRSGTGIKIIVVMPLDSQVAAIVVPTVAHQPAATARYTLHDKFTLLLLKR